MAALLGWRVFCLDRGLDRLPVKAVIPNWGYALGEASGNVSMFQEVIGKICCNYIL